MRHYCTLFDINYFAKGLALYNSLLAHGGEFHLFILALDKQTFWLLEEMQLKHATVIPLEVIERAKQLEHVKASRGQLEYYWTLASQLMEYLLRPYLALTMLTYLDADLYFYSSPEPIFSEMAGASIAIIPHRFHRGNMRLIVNGVYNVGWLTIKNDLTGMKCLTDWAAQCRAWCFHRNEEGKFGDQGYLDSWPYDYGTACRVIENIGAGAAPWNIANYDATGGSGQVYLSHAMHPPVAHEGPLDFSETITNYPLIFYHFHEFMHDGAGNPLRLTRHQTHHMHRQLIYNPYIIAIKEAVIQMTVAQHSCDRRTQQNKEQGERA